MPLVTSDNAKFAPDQGHKSASDNESPLTSRGQDRLLGRDKGHHQKFSVVFCPFATKTREPTYCDSLFSPSESLKIRCFAAGDKMFPGAHLAATIFKAGITCLAPVRVVARGEGHDGATL
jgi:hypothetical protein